MDCLTPIQRKKAMVANKGKETKIEVLLRLALWKSGVRYRKNVKDIMGIPDIAIKKYKLAIFCDGDFWHGKRDVSKCKKYWIDKIQRNKERDLEVTIFLRDAGWTVFRFWETDIRKNIGDCVNEVVKFINSKNKAI